MNPERPGNQDRLQGVLSPERRLQLCRTLGISEDSSSEEIIHAYIEDEKEVSGNNLDIDGAINSIRYEWGPEAE